MIKNHSPRIQNIGKKGYVHPIVYAIVLFFLISCSKKGSGSSSTPPPPGDTAVVYGKFEVKDSKILDSSGNEFIARGVNVNGPLWPWTRETIPDIPLIADIWKCNIVRINCWPLNPPFQHNNNSDLDAIIKGFNDKKVVAVIEDHSFTGTYPTTDQLNTSVSWWVALAKKYKNNGMVWFNLMNEPGNGGDAPAIWLNAHDAIIHAIRATGAGNIIVCDEHSYGQANGFDKTASSAALTYGPTLTGKYKNIVFSLHLYSNWTYGQDKLENYVTAVKAQKLALIFGEYGTGLNTDISSEVASGMFKVAIPEKIGRIGWHWVGQDIFTLTNTSGGFAIDNISGSKPGNLSFGGNLVWDDNDGTLTANAPELVPLPVIISNPDFEEYSNPLTDIPGWINFGTATLDNTAANVMQGTYSVKINDGAVGGCGEAIYLEPGGTYKLTAWGKNSVVASSPSSIGINYTTTQGGTESSAVSLNFTENSFVEKTATFTIPATITSMRIFIYKLDPAPAFWVDDIRIQKQ